MLGLNATPERLPLEIGERIIWGGRPSFSGIIVQTCLGCYLYIFSAISIGVTFRITLVYGLHMQYYVDAIIQSLSGVFIGALAACIEHMYFYYIITNKRIIFRSLWWREKNFLGLHPGADMGVIWQIDSPASVKISLTFGKAGTLTFLPDPAHPKIKITDGRFYPRLYTPHGPIRVKGKLIGVPDAVSVGTRAMAAFESTRSGAD